MSHCASFLCLNGLFEFSFFRAGHLTAGDGTLEPAEIVAVLRTAYRVFFENSQMFGATRHWSDWKFVASEQQGVGTYGNSFSASDDTQKLAEICSQRATRRWNERKLSQRGALLTEFSYGKLARGVGKTQKHAVFIHSQTTAAEDGGKK